MNTSRAPRWDWLSVCLCARVCGGKGVSEQSRIVRADDFDCICISLSTRPSPSLTRRLG